MLYLEDYIELVEIVPQELRDRFTEMRLLDLQSQNLLDQLNNKVNHFYSKAATMSPEQRQKQYETLLQEYNKPLIDSEEKINLATQIQEFLNKYTRKLEQDIQKFKLELEADNSGITEILEKRVTDSQPKESQRTNVMGGVRNKMSTKQHNKTEDSCSGASRSEKGINERVASQHHDYSYSLPTNYNNGHTSMSSSGGSSQGQNPINYSLSNIGAGGIAITAAASQAIAATQQMKQGRRTASLKASYEAIHGAGTSTADMNISKELAGAAQTAIAAIQDTHKKNKKKTTSNLSMGTINVNTSTSLHSLMMETSSSNKLHATTAGAASSSTSSSSLIDNSSQQLPEEDMDTNSYGADEPRYCQCNEVAFGVMVACDSKNCPYEWYHCECVGIAPDNPPKGKWYCPICIDKMNSKATSYNSSNSRKQRRT